MLECDVPGGLCHEWDQQGERGEQGCGGSGAQAHPPKAVPAAPWPSVPDLRDGGAGLALGMQWALGTVDPPLSRLTRPELSGRKRWDRGSCGGF